MNKYASGYSAMGIITGFGGLVVAMSLIGGVAMMLTMPRGMGYIGLIVAVSGSVQGLLMLGVGSIGTAVLDGAVAQQEIAAGINKKENVSPSRERQDLMPYLLAANLGSPGGEFLENYKGKFLIKDANGEILMGNDVFPSVKAARAKIDKSENEIVSAKIAAAAALENISFDPDGSLIFNGYKIPRRNNEFLLNGRSYLDPQDVAKQILEEKSWALSKYKI